MELQFLGQAPGFLGNKRLVQGRRGVRAQVVQDHPDYRGVGDRSRSVWTGSSAKGSRTSACSTQGRSSKQTTGRFES